jgi:hypothetical protein
LPLAQAGGEPFVKGVFCGLYSDWGSSFQQKAIDDFCELLAVNWLRARDDDAVVALELLGLLLVA